MAKIDVSKIDGYEAMSAEEKLAALEAYEFEETAPTNDNETKLKEALTRASADASEWKKKYRATLDDAKRAEEERAERDKARDDELETLRKERTISKLEAQYLSVGYSAELAAASAKAQADGDTATVLANQTKFLSDMKSKLEAEALGKQPPLTPGKPPEADKSEDDKLSETMMKYAGL